MKVLWIDTELNESKVAVCFVDFDNESLYICHYNMRTGKLDKCNTYKTEYYFKYQPQLIEGVYDNVELWKSLTTVYAL